MIARQAASFVAVGLTVNAALYVAYLLLTHMRLGSFAAMTVTYSSGVVLSFLLNRRFTFRFDGAKSAAFVRFFCAYLFGYLINFAGLWFLVDRCGIPHQVAQGLMILGLSVLLFFLQRQWVFKTQLPSHPARFMSSSQ